MKNELSKEIVDKVLKKAKNIEEIKGDEDFSRAEISRRCFIMRHCGVRAVRVRTFYNAGEKCPSDEKLNEYRGKDVIVCPVCSSYGIGSVFPVYT